ncbi:hypothetical protein BJ741DRAFT_589608 [Chytriomyces cf. hyalinus JEL632]|nr:hypothetical protein BJ741DRAFT_589608 [Chytriomyces cf. hyalinus JEL632]
MFKSAFQGGPCFEVFSCQGSTSSALMNWRIHNKQFVKKEYEKDVKGYCFTCEKSGKLTLPKDEKQSAYLIQPYLILQLYVGVAQHMSLEICVSDLNQSKRRFFLSTAARETKITALHVTLPIGFIKRGMWLNLCFDLLSLVGDSFKGQTFRCLDSISIAGNYRLRKVFTMKLPPPDTTDDYDIYDDSMEATLGLDCIPRHMQYGVGIDNTTQIINHHRIKAAEKMELRRALDESIRGACPQKGSDVHSLPRIAFGSRPTSEIISAKKPVKRARSAKSKKDDDVSVVSKSSSRASLHSRSSQSPSHAVVKLPPIFEAKSFTQTNEDPESATEEEYFEASPIREIEKSSETMDAGAMARPLDDDQEAELPSESLPESFPQGDLTSEDITDETEPQNMTVSSPGIVTPVEKYQAPPVDEYAAEESTLDKDIEAFFKAQEDQQDNPETAEDEMESSSEIQLDAQYLQHGESNMDDIISALDQMIDEDRITYSADTDTTIPAGDDGNNSNSNSKELDIDHNSATATSEINVTESENAQVHKSNQSKSQNQKPKKDSSQIEAKSPTPDTPVDHSSNFEFRVANSVIHFKTTESLLSELRPTHDAPKVSIRSKPRRTKSESLPVDMLHANAESQAQRKVGVSVDSVALKKLKKKPAKKNPIASVGRSLQLNRTGAETRSHSHAVVGHKSPADEGLIHVVPEDVPMNEPDAEAPNAGTLTSTMSCESVNESISAVPMPESSHLPEESTTETPSITEFERPGTESVMPTQDIMPDVGQSRTVSSEINKKLIARCEAMNTALLERADSPEDIIHEMGEAEVSGCEMEDSLVPQVSKQETQTASAATELSEKKNRTSEEIPVSVPQDLVLTDSVCDPLEKEKNQNHEGLEITIDPLDVNITANAVIVELSPAAETGAVPQSHPSEKSKRAPLDKIDPSKLLPVLKDEIAVTMDHFAAAAENLTVNITPEDDETLELMYDAETNSYFDPETGKYYEIEESDEEKEAVQ